MLLNKINKMKKNGFSMIELMSVIGLATAAIAIALSVTTSVINKKDIKYHSANISSIYANMTSLYSDESPESSNLMDTLITAKVFPSALDIDVKKGTVKNADRGNVEVDADDDGYTLTYNKIKVGACTDVIKNQKRIGWTNWGVVGGTGDANTDSRFSDDTDSTVAKIAKACSDAAGKKDWVSLAFDTK